MPHWIFILLIIVSPLVGGAQTAATTNTLGATGVVGIQSTTSANGLFSIF